MLGLLAMLAIGLLPVQEAPAAAAQARPAPAPTLYIVTYRPGPAWIAGKPMRQQKLGPHVAFIRGLLADGRLVAGGPFTDDREGGMAILRATSLDEARKILATDPAVTAGVFEADLRPWQPLYDSGRSLAP
ncbi:MAG: YciI family protein [Pseudomonadota bacterium]